MTQTQPTACCPDCGMSLAENEPHTCPEADKKSNRLTATEIRFRQHIWIAANAIGELRATDIDRLVVELPETLDTGAFLRWLIEQPDLPNRAHRRAIELNEIVGRKHRQKSQHAIWTHFLRVIDQEGIGAHENQHKKRSLFVQKPAGCPIPGQHCGRPKSGNRSAAHQVCIPENLESPVENPEEQGCVIFRHRLVDIPEGT